ncbi:hypothetical protein LINPERHAP1_LOCUS26584 [Linum perenne]
MLSWTPSRKYQSALAPAFSAWRVGSVSFPLAPWIRWMPLLGNLLGFFIDILGYCAEWKLVN